MTDFRALCAELADELTQFNAWYIEDNGYGLPNLEALLRRCDAALAKPKPPSLAEQALDALNIIEDKMLGPTVEEILIRRALERLQELEKGNE